MSNENKARLAHKILDDLFKGNMVLDEKREFLRRALPELPAQKTLAEIIAHVDDAWMGASGNEWAGNSYNTEISIEDWLRELYEQLQGLKGTPAAVPVGLAPPEFLETEADYTDVPEGTILTIDGLDTAWVKKFDGWVSTEVSRERSSKELGYTRRRVLRWGWG